MLFIFLLVLGLVVGSFLGALTYRFPLGISVVKGFSGRSVCPHCKHRIRWYDNIPLLSYFLLKRKCRDCKKKISVREPLIEAGTAFVFLLLGYLHSPLFLFLIAPILIVIFMIDIEHQLIFDEFVWIGILLSLLNLILNNGDIWGGLTAGFGAALFLLIIHLVTLGKGMGLGDVKLAIFLGITTGINLVFWWMFASFVIGAVIGVILIVLKMAKFKQKIAFGPFLIIGFFVVMLYGKIFY